MSGSNGHSMNGDGGRGHCSLADLLDPHRARGAAGILASAIRNKYIDLFAIDYVATKKAVAGMMKSEDMRIRAAAAKLAVAMAGHDLNLMTVLDKTGRLDADTPTEITEQRVLQLEFDDRT